VRVTTSFDESELMLVFYILNKWLDIPLAAQKCVTLHFTFVQQGEGVPEVRKGSCANHVRDVQNLLKVCY